MIPRLPFVHMIRSSVEVNLLWYENPPSDCVRPVFDFVCRDDPMVQLARPLVFRLARVDGEI